MPRFPDDDLYIDHDGILVERCEIGGQSVVVHYEDDIPESDITMIDGIRVTTALRTTIDMAPSLEPHELRDMLDNFLGRRLFTVADAWARIEQPDMRNRRGAEILRRVLPPC